MGVGEEEEEGRRGRGREGGGGGEEREGEGRRRRRRGGEGGGGKEEEEEGRRGRGRGGEGGEGKEEEGKGGTHVYSIHVIHEHINRSEHLSSSNATVYMLMRDEEGRKKEASKAIQTTRQSNTTHMYIYM